MMSNHSCNVKHEGLPSRMRKDVLAPAHRMSAMIGFWELCPGN
jgi:hypothetical protein